MNKSFKYRLYPNKKQEELFQKTFGCCRFIYNKMLADKKEHYKLTKQALHNTPAQYKAEFDWLKEVDSQALANEQMHLQTAFNNFFRNPKTGYPKFKSKKHDKKSYSTSYVHFSKKNGYIHLGKLGEVKAKIHREIPSNYKIKLATISQSGSGKYYISILTEYEYTVPVIELDKTKSLGLDYSSPEFYVDNLGNKPGYQRFYRKYQDELAKEQRKLSHMKLHSNNYEKQLKRVNLVHEKISNCRKDFIEKLSRELADTYDIICVEDIDLRTMSKSLHLGKSTMDNGFGMFRVRLQQKLELQGKKLIKIGRFEPTSVVCSNCGTYHKDIVDSVKVREWTCPDCNTHHDRDVNAAKNILNKGLDLI